mmetsp:Transcript_27564/g.58287  ORF Transcript_27564/g.58287 Transcript_27564/m.58287 type:complete len:237 (-) Transcript_27564:883-1593(-)
MPLRILALDELGSHWIHADGMCCSPPPVQRSRRPMFPLRRGHVLEKEEVHEVVRNHPVEANEDPTTVAEHGGEGEGPRASVQPVLFDAERKPKEREAEHQALQEEDPAVMGLLLLGCESRTRGAILGALRVQRLVDEDDVVLQLLRHRLDKSMAVEKMLGLPGRLPKLAPEFLAGGAPVAGVHEGTAIGPTPLHVENLGGLEHENLGPSLAGVVGLVPLELELQVHPIRTRLVRHR